MSIQFANSKKLYIQYMVSLRCKLKVIEELEFLKLDYSLIELGVVEIKEELSMENRLKLQINLKKSGLILLDDKQSILVERIKNTVTEMIHSNEEKPIINYSDYIAEKLGYNYTYLAYLFSEVKGITIQHYIILHKIELTKELLIYDELSLTEIADKLHYSSVSHLSNQFKKITGLSPSYFKHIAQKQRVNLENV